MKLKSLLVFFLGIIFIVSFFSGNSFARTFVPCGEYDALCQLDCVPGEPCGYWIEDTPEPTCPAGQKKHATTGNCIYDSDASCRAVFGEAYYDGNGTDGCACLAGAVYSHTTWKCEFPDNCPAGQKKHATTGNCIYDSDASCRAVFGEAYYDGNGTDGCACLAGATYSHVTWKCEFPDDPYIPDVPEDDIPPDCPDGKVQHPSGSCIWGSDAACEAALGDAVFDNSPDNGCTCAPKAYYIEDLRQCVYVRALCGPDPLIDYDLGSGSCFCPEGYALSGDNVCGMADVEIEFDFPESKPPFIADGKTEAKINVSVKNSVTGEGIPARFSVDYSSIDQKGMVVRVDDLGDGEYLVIYRTPNITSSKYYTGLHDYLYVYYTVPGEAEDKYKTQQIDLTRGVPIKITKSGFKDVESSVSFTAPTANVNVYTINHRGEKVPVRDAKVGIRESFYFEMTGDDGVAALESREEVDGNEVSETEVTLEIIDEVKAWQEKAKEQYGKIVSGENGISNDTVRDFISNTATYLAGNNEEDTIKTINGIKRISYAMMFLNEGRSLANDVSANLAEGIKDQVASLMEVLDVSKMIQGKLEEKLGSQIKALNGKIEGFNAKITSKISDLKISKDAMKIVEDIKKGVTKYTPDSNKANKEWTNKLYGEVTSFLVSDISERINEMSQKVREKTLEYFKAGIKKHVPSFNGEWIDAIFGYIAEMSSNPFTVETIDPEKIGEELPGKVLDATGIEGKLADYFKDQYQESAEEVMKQMANMVSLNQFNPYSFDFDMIEAKYDSQAMRSEYLGAHEVQLEVSYIKADADLFLASVNKAGTITGLWPKAADAIEKTYKVIKAGVINNVALYYWFDAYSGITDKSLKNVYNALGVDLQAVSNDVYGERFALLPVSYAFGKEDAWELIKGFSAQTEVEKKDKAVDYYVAAGAVDFYKSLSDVNDAMIMFDPENGELLALKDNLEESLLAEQKIVNNLESEVVAMIEEAGSDKNENTPYHISYILSGVAVLLFFAGLVVSVVMFILRKKKIGLYTLLGTFVVPFVLLVIAVIYN